MRPAGVMSVVQHTFDGSVCECVRDQCALGRYATLRTDDANRGVCSSHLVRHVRTPRAPRCAVLAHRLPPVCHTQFEWGMNCSFRGKRSNRKQSKRWITHTLILVTHQATYSDAPAAVSRTRPSILTAGASEVQPVGRIGVARSLSALPDFGRRGAVAPVRRDRRPGFNLSFRQWLLAMPQAARSPSIRCMAASRRRSLPLRYPDPRPPRAPHVGPKPCFEVVCRTY